MLLAELNLEDYFEFHKVTKYYFGVMATPCDPWVRMVDIQDLVGIFLQLPGLVSVLGMYEMFEEAWTERHALCSRLLPPAAPYPAHPSLAYPPPSL